MSFGYGVGDIITTTKLAWTVWKSCRNAPESFSSISQETLSLHAVLKEAEEIFSGRELTNSQQEGLQTVVNGCKAVLRDLQALLGKYESLGSQSKRTWDRLRWGDEDIAKLRMRLTSNAALFNAFLQYVSRTVRVRP